MKFPSQIIPTILAISHEIMQNFANFSLKIMINNENYHSRISQFTQMVKCEIMFTHDSREFLLQLITSWDLRSYIEI